MILGFIPQFESRDYKKNAPENIGSKNRSGKKGRGLPEMSHQIFVTSKRKKIELELEQPEKSLGRALKHVKLSEAEKKKAEALKAEEEKKE